MNQVIVFLETNLESVLAAISIISFVINILQYKTNRNTKYIFESIYQNCYRTARIDEKKPKTNSELMHIIYMIRDQATAGLRSLGIRKTYGSFDGINTGFVYRFFQSTFHLIKKIREKWPVAFPKNVR